MGLPEDPGGASESAGNVRTATLHLEGIEVEGRHGASAGEQDTPQQFIVDLEVDVAPSSDELGATGDYRAIIAVVRELVAEESFELLETLALQIVEAARRVPGVKACRATVHKPAAAARLGARDIAAEAEGKS